MANYGDQEKMYKQAVRTKKKREKIIKTNALHPCRKCGEEKPAGAFVIQYMTNQYVGKYRYLYECKACKRARTYKRRKKKRKTIDGALEVVVKHLYQGAKKKNLEFGIAKDDLKELWESQDGTCYYTGYEMTYTSISSTSGTLNEKSKFQLSCDRLDNTIGYKKDNIVLCCSFVNRMKGDMTEEEFYTVCKDILQQRK